MLHCLRQDVLVETPERDVFIKLRYKGESRIIPGEVALQELVVIDSLGNDSTNKLEIAQVVGVNVAEVIDCVGHLQEGGEKRLQEIMSSFIYPVSWTALEECVVRVEDFPRDDHIPGHSMKNLSEIFVSHHSLKSPPAS